MTSSSPLTSAAPEAIFVPIDLEASLGRIEEPIGPNGQGQDQAMDCCEHYMPQPHPFYRNTRTSSKTPFSPETSTASIAPYPVTETDAEIKERHRFLDLSGNVGRGIIQQLGTPFPLYETTTTGDNHSMMEVTATDSPLDDDDFSLEDDDDFSLAQAAAQLERIDDPVSFWEESMESLPPQPSEQQQQQLPVSIEESASSKASPASSTESSMTE